MPNWERLIADVRRVAAEARAVDPDDEQLIADAIEGETDLHEAASYALREIAELELMAEALKARIAEMETRRRRFETAARKLRQRLADALREAGQNKLVLPEGTISLRKPTWRVVVLNPAELPQGFTRTKVEPDKDAIRAHLTSGFAVPGAELVQGDWTVSIRRQ